SPFKAQLRWVDSSGKGHPWGRRRRRSCKRSIFLPSTNTDVLSPTKKWGSSCATGRSLESVSLKHRTEIRQLHVPRGATSATAVRGDGPGTGVAIGDKTSLGEERSNYPGI